MGFPSGPGAALSITPVLRKHEVTCSMSVMGMRQLPKSMLWECHIPTCLVHPVTWTCLKDATNG